MIGRRIAASAVLVVAVSVTTSCHAFDATSPGEPRAAHVIWQVALPALGPPAFDDSTVYFSLRTHLIVAVNRASGSVRWFGGSGLGGSSLTVEETPVRATDVVVFGDWNLTAFDAKTGAFRWVFGDQFSGDGPGLYMFQTDGTTIYTGSATGGAFALDAASGRLLWRVDLVPGKGNQVRAYAVRDGRVYLTVRHNGLRFAGRVYVLDARTGATIWSYELPRADGSPNGTNGIVLCQSGTGRRLVVVSFDDGRIAALDAADATVQWTIAARSIQNDDRNMAAAAGILIASGLSPDVVDAYDLETGAMRWEMSSTQGSVEIGPGHVSADSSVARVNFTNGVIGTYDLRTGALRDLLRAPTSFFTNTPVGDRGAYFLGGWDHAFAIRL
ncbi:MAG TPA: PQQ-binding-like beta-propeller repeat protein [Gemmatimonadaceae bacterium]|nr:PQQ-binding-like beta-propeller repeat protein [Gemmatimonadaceae bacterium]